jgi:hypothetical protein
MRNLRNLRNLPAATQRGNYRFLCNLLKNTHVRSVNRLSGSAVFAGSATSRSTLSLAGRSIQRGACGVPRRPSTGALYSCCEGTAEMVGRYTAKQGARQSAAVRIAERRVQF